MKGMRSGKFDVKMWYPNANLAKNTKFLSAYASHHAKLQKLEHEVEECEYLLEQAIQSELYEEADGLSMRVERLRDMHPIWSIEQVHSTNNIYDGVRSAQLAQPEPLH
jgi:hypothetical protein